MNEELLRQLQLCQLEIGKEIKRVCEENDIKYFLDSGTLLGAVRHKGFIPWDDDMDIGMIRTEYEKFIKIAPEKLNNKYYLQTWDNDKNYPFAFAKVRKKGTLCIEAGSQYSKNGSEVYVDIFPYDYYPKSRIDQIKQGMNIMKYKKMMLMKSNYTPWERHDGIIERFLVYIKYLPYILMNCFITREKLINKYNVEMVKYNSQKSDFMYEQTGGTPYGKWVLPTRCLLELDDIKFEDTYFSASKDYDKYLRTIYKDYMKLPPEDRRGNWHQFIKIEL